MPSRILLGRAFPSSSRSVSRSLGGIERRTPPLGNLVGGGVAAVDGQKHILSIAPPGSNKAGSAIIPNLLHHSGPAVVIDPTGDYYRATIRTRSELGPVLRLDPFRMINQDTDALNPLDLIDLVTSDVESGCQLVADLVSPRVEINTAQENQAFGLLSAIVGYIIAVPEKNRFSEVFATLRSEDVVYNLCVVLDTIGKRLCQLSYTEIASFVQLSETDRNRVLFAATAHHTLLAIQEVSRTLDASSVPLSEIVDGTPLTVYLMIPSARLRNYALLMRIWLGLLLHCVTSRRNVPAVPTLFLLDEAAQLGHVPIFETALTACHGRGLQVWTFWDDLSQLRQLYPATWPAIIKNCGALQLFGDSDFAAAGESAALAGLEPDDVRFLEPDDLAIRLNGTCHRVRQLDYLTDPLFAGQFD